MGLLVQVVEQDRTEEIQTSDGENTGQNSALYYANRLCHLPQRTLETDSMYLTSLEHWRCRPPTLNLDIRFCFQSSTELYLEPDRVWMTASTNPGSLLIVHHPCPSKRSSRPCFTPGLIIDITDHCHHFSEVRSTE